MKQESDKKPETGFYRFLRTVKCDELGGRLGVFHITNPLYGGPNASAMYKRIFGMFVFPAMKLRLLGLQVMQVIPGKG